MARRRLRARRVGHTGTLDPFATGLLVLLVGRTTRLAPYLVQLGKTYIGVIRFGARSDTDDATGVLSDLSDCWGRLSDHDIAGGMQSLTGRSLQRPPAYSARKVGGERAYRRARRGQAVTLESREVRVERFQMVGRRGADVSFEAEVGSGTYVRALARDLGVGLDCCAHLASLRRLRVGPFDVADAVPLEQVGCRETAPRPSADAVPHLPRHEIDDETRWRVRHGQAIEVPEGVGGGPVALMAGGELIAVAERQGPFLKPRVVLAE